MRERSQGQERAGKQKVVVLEGPCEGRRKKGFPRKSGERREDLLLLRTHTSFAPINTSTSPQHPSSSAPQRRSLTSSSQRRRRRRSRGPLASSLLRSLDPLCLPVVCPSLVRSPAASDMSSAVCESRLPSPCFMVDGLGGGGRCGDAATAAAEAAAIELWLAQQEAAIEREAAEKKDGQLDIWASIQSSKKEAEPGAPYVHPLVRRSASSLSQKSLEICTESLGSETGSDGVLSPGELGEYLPWPASDEEEVAEGTEEAEQQRQQHREAEDAERVLPPTPPTRRRELAAVNYHCSISKRSLPRAFPPPLPSLSRRDGPCLSMRPHRRDGRLVVEAVSVPSQNYLHARRQDGRLLLTIVETTLQEAYPEREEPAMQHLQQQQQQLQADADADGPEADEEDRRRSADDDAADSADVDEEEVEDEEEEDEEGEEEVEVFDRGIVVEVKVSRPPQPQSGGMKVQRSSVVINKFVGAAMEGELAATPSAPPQPAPGYPTATTTTTATAVVAAAAAASSSLSTDERYWRHGTGPQSSSQRHPSPEKLFFTSKRQMNRQDLLHQVRRCSEHLRPLFIWERCCIATS